jgi:hypothetical protein
VFFAITNIIFPYPQPVRRVSQGVRVHKLGTTALTQHITYWTRAWLQHFTNMKKSPLQLLVLYKERNSSTLKHTNVTLEDGHLCRNMKCALQWRQVKRGDHQLKLHIHSKKEAKSQVSVKQNTVMYYYYFRSNYGVGTLWDHAPVSLTKLLM